MSQRRMFSPDIVCSDAFLDMPPSTRELYFQLGMAADDDGFVNPKRTMRLVNASEDDLKLLLAKRFILPFQSGVVVVKHWLIHNLIRADLYKETLYKKEKESLGLNENGAYTELRDGVSELKQIEAPKWLKIRRGELRTANVPQTARRIGKDRLGKDIHTASQAPQEFSLKSGIQKLYESPRRDLNLIGWYFEKREPNIQNIEQLQTAIKRHLRSAKLLSPFSDAQLGEAHRFVSKEYPEWTLDTIIKKLTK